MDAAIVVVSEVVSFRKKRKVVRDWIKRREILGGGVQYTLEGTCYRRCCKLLQLHENERELL